MMKTAGGSPTQVRESGLDTLSNQRSLWRWLTQIIKHWGKTKVTFLSISVPRSPPAQRGQSELLLPIWARLHHWSAPWHLAWYPDLLQESALHRYVFPDNESSTCEKTAFYSRFNSVISSATTGVAATRLPNNKFYPMVCSTAAKSSMKVIRACHTPTSLQYLCCARLHQMLPCCPDILSALELPPGLRTLLHVQLGWVFTLSSSPEASEQPRNLPEEFHDETSLPLSPSPVLPLSACTSRSPRTSPFPEAVSYQCPCQTSPQTQPCTCHCPPTPPSSDYDSCCSEPEDYQCKRCRWTWVEVKTYFQLFVTAILPLP